MGLISRILAYPLVILVSIYQKTISPDHGFVRVLYPYGYCKFHPTCSEYSKQVLLKQGVIGLPKIIKRLLICNPWSQGGIDLP